MVGFFMKKLQTLTEGQKAVRRRQAAAKGGAARAKKLRDAKPSKGLSNYLLREIDIVEQLAHKLGMHVTAHALNRAKNAAGWEIAGDVEQAGKAARDERPSK